MSHGSLLLYVKVEFRGMPTGFGLKIFPVILLGVPCVKFRFIPLDRSSQWYFSLLAKYFIK